MNCYSIYYSRKAAPLVICHTYIYSLDEESAVIKFKTLTDDTFVRQVLLHDDITQCAPEYFG